MSLKINFNPRIRVDYSITRRAHSPTPGVYLGQKKDKAPKLSPSKREKEISPDRTPVKYPYKGRSRTKSMSPDSIAKRYVTKSNPFFAQPLFRTAKVRSGAPEPETRDSSRDRNNRKRTRSRSRDRKRYFYRPDWHRIISQGILSLGCDECVKF